MCTVLDGALMGAARFSGYGVCESCSGSRLSSPIEPYTFSTPIHVRAAASRLPYFSTTT